MRKVFLFFSLVFPVFLSSCIEIRETLTINGDGSGNIKLVVDMGKIGKSLGQQTQQINMSFVTAIQNTPGMADSLLRSCKGVSNLITSAGNDNGIYSVSFDFSDTRSLNNALYKLFRQKKSAFRPDFIKVSVHKTIQKNVAPMIKKYLLKEETNMMSDMLYQLIKIKTTVQLPSKVKSITNIKATEENEGKTVKLEYSLFELLNNDFDYGIKIKY
ncbi:MAG TPA: hypothetical protein PKW80_13720 [Bacteroidales bacterium]|nr:hypothetical protein [Bacteroidales bacterium]